MKLRSGAILSFDFGMKHIGVAVGNRESGTCQALAVIKAKDGRPNWAQVTRYVREWQPKTILVGDPLNMDGSDSGMCAKARRFGRQLEGRYQLEVVMVDERLSSAEAKSRAREQGHSGDYRAAPIDADAAKLILETWLTTC